jgi:hypothetical protein
MKRMSAMSVGLAAVLFGLLLYLPVTAVDALAVERVTGVVQDWAPERGYIVLAGKRYELHEGFGVVDEAGYTVPIEHVKVGALIRVTLEMNAVLVIMLVQDESVQ